MQVDPGTNPSPAQLWLLHSRLLHVISVMAALSLQVLGSKPSEALPSLITFVLALQWLNVRFSGLVDMLQPAGGRGAGDPEGERTILRQSELLILSEANLQDWLIATGNCSYRGVVHLA